MKIGFSCFGLGGGKSGLSTYVRALLEAMQKQDKVDQFKLFQPTPFLEKPIVNILWHNFVLPFISKKEKLDLVHIPTIRRIPLIKGTKVIATVHDLAVFALPGKYDYLRRIYHHHFLSKLIHRCDHVIAVSHHTKADIVKYTGYPEEKITVIYSGIDHSLFRPVKDRQTAILQLQQKYGIDKPFFVYVSRIEHPGKNHLNMIKAFELFTKQYGGGYQLVLAGADWSGAEVVKQYASNSAVKDDIIFTGFAPTEDIVNFYSLCELMVFPSLYEGFGFPLLEALACGAKVASARTSSLEELGEGNVEFFDPLDPTDIASTMEKTLLLPWKKDGIEYASQFTWKKCAREVLNTYQRCVDGKI